MTFRFVVLAAGKGTRMKMDIPKALIPVGGKPIIQYILEFISASGVDGAPVLVVSPDRPKLCEPFGGVCEYVVQQEPLGTGHAVLCAKDALQGSDAVIVMHGDHPFFSAETLRQLAKTHEANKGVLTMVTTSLPSYDGWYQVFRHWGRILRDTHGHVVGIREYKDAMESEQALLEVNPALYCFDASWLWENIAQLKNINAKAEYYITDMVELSVAQGHEIATISVPPEEAIGVNTQEELAVAEEVLSRRYGNA